MRPFQSTTEARLPAFLQQVSRWPLALRHLHERVATYFARAEPRRHALLYLQAVLSDIPRKNGWQIADYAKELRPSGMQRLLSRAVWDQDGVRDELRSLLCQVLTPSASAAAPAEPATPFPVLVLE